jgi:AcrR family transcriptional regulator
VASNAGNGSEGSDDHGFANRRVRGEDRRAELIEHAAALLEREGIDAVSMEAVATRVGVSRPLVYKHFANRDELLVAVYQEKASQLEASIAAAVRQARGFEDKLRTLIRLVLEAMSTHGAIFIPLRRAGVRNVGGLRDELMARDERTIRYFARVAVREFDVSYAEARVAMAILLSGLESVRAQWRVRPTPEHRQFLEDLYVEVALGALARLRGR